MASYAPLALAALKDKALMDVLQENHNLRAKLDKLSNQAVFLRGLGRRRYSSKICRPTGSAKLRTYLTQIGNDFS